MGLSFWHILIVLFVVLVVFGAGRLPHVMGDLGKGIRSFKAGLGGDALHPTEKTEVQQSQLPPHNTDNKQS